MVQAGVVPVLAEDVRGAGRESSDELEAAASAAAPPYWQNTFDVFVVGKQRCLQPVVGPEMSGMLVLLHQKALNC